MPVPIEDSFFSTDARTDTALVGDIVTTAFARASGGVTGNRTTIAVRTESDGWTVSVPERLASDIVAEVAKFPKVIAIAVGPKVTHEALRRVVRGE